MGNISLIRKEISLESYFNVIFNTVKRLNEKYILLKDKDKDELIEYSLENEIIEYNNLLNNL
jgi:hypothetical protein